MAGLPDALGEVRPGGAAPAVPLDADLVARALAGSERAFHDLVRRYWPKRLGEPLQIRLCLTRYRSIPHEEPDVVHPAHG